MTTMNVQMSLSLVDSASAPLQAFVQVMNDLKVATNSVATRLNNVAEGMKAIGAAASTNALVGSFATELARLAASLTAVKSSAGGVGAELTSIGNRAGGASIATDKLAISMTVLGEMLSKTTGALAAAVEQLTAVGVSARAAGTGAAAGIAALEAPLGAANEKASTLTTSLKGLAQIYAAFKIEKGLKTASEEAISYEATRTRLKTLGIGDGEQADMIAAADATSRATPQFSKNETLAMAIDLRNATGSVEHALNMLGPFATAAFNMKMATPEGKEFNERDMLLIAKALEQRNATMDPERMNAELEMFTKAYVATQGRVDAQQLLGNLQYSKGGLGQTMDLSFLPTFVAMIEQVRSAGGNGGQVGTWLTTLQQAVIQGQGNGRAQKERAALGLVDPDKLVWNRQGNVDQQKSDLRMAGASEFQHNPYEWVQNYLKPAMIRAGIDLTNDAAVNETLNRLFPNRNAANVASMMITRGPLIEKDAANVEQAKAGDEAKDINVRTARAQIDAFKKQMENLGIVLGATLLPAITAIAKAFTAVFEQLAAFFQAFPATATFATYATAIGAVVLAVYGFRNVFGILTTFATMLRGVGPAAEAGAAGVAAAAAVSTEATAASTAAATGRFAALSSGIATALGFIASNLLRAVSVIGLFMLAWDFASLIANMEVGGHKISEWAEQLARHVGDVFETMWIRTKQFFGFISQAAADAEIAGNRAALGQRDQAFNAGKAPSYQMHESNVTGSDWEDKPTPVGTGKLFKPSTGPGKTSAPGRFAHYDAALDAQKNAYRLAEDAAKRDADEQKRQYEANLITANEYFDDRLEALKKSVAAEIAILEKEKAAYARQGDKAGVNRTQTDITIKQRELASGESNIELERKRALAKLDKDMADFQREALRASGENHQAELTHIQQEIDAKAKQLLLEGRITQAQVDAVKARAVAASNYGYGHEEIVRLQDEERRKEEAITAAVQNGTKTQFQAENEIYALRQQLAQQLDGLIERLRVMANESGDPKLVQQIGDIAAKNKVALDELPPVMRQFNQEMSKAISSGFGNVLYGIAHGAKAAKKSIADLGASIQDTFLHIISQRLGEQLFGSLFGGGGGAGGAAAGMAAGGGGGLFGSLGGWLGGALGSLFGGGGAAAAGSSSGFGAVAGSTFGTSGMQFSFDSLATLLPAFATGIDSVPDDMLAVIHKNERVMTADDNAQYTKLSDMVGRSSESPAPQTVMHVTNNFSVSGQTNHNTMSQIALHAGTGISRAMKRNG